MAEKIQYIDANKIVVKENENAGLWQNFPVAAIPTHAPSGYYSDFHVYNPEDWTVTAVNSSTVVATDVENGAITLTSDTTENDGVQIQNGTTTVGESFLPEAGRTIWFECKFQSNDIDQVDAFVGLAINDTAILASNPANMIGFITHDGDALLDFYHNGSIDESLATMSDATDITVGFKIIGTDYCEYYVNGVLAGTTTSDLPATEMKLSLALLTGEAAANTLQVDYVACYQTR